MPNMKCGVENFSKKNDKSAVLGSTRISSSKLNRSSIIKKNFSNKLLLFVDYATPMYDKFAGSRTNFMYLKLLSLNGMTVKFMPSDFQRIEPYTSKLHDLEIETLDGKRFSGHWEEWLWKNGPNVDYVFFNKPDPTIKFIDAVRRLTNAAIIYQCHDLHYLRLRRKAKVDSDEIGLSEANHYQKRENYIFEHSDVILTFSSFEESIIREKFPHKKVVTVPLFFYDTVQSREIEYKNTRDLLFVGSCAHAPNRDAINWFCNEILPLVKHEIPEVILNVVGSKPPKEIKKLKSKNIRILSGVNDEELERLYKSTRLALIPLRYGAGVKGKTIEAMYHGVPLVSTKIGLEGIEGIEKIASPQDRPSDFARQVVALYNDEKKWKKMAQNCSDFVAEHFTSQKTATQLNHILEIAKEEQLKRHSAAEAPRLIAFYLPQYHPIPENDEWWGRGFTEWRNVAKAEPLFPGHYQPHLPADLGFYDLRAEEARIAQAEIAKEYGIFGFCYYHYWFNGKRLLERPVEEMLSSKKPDFPFCLCWANENWTRRWDGEDQQVLMEQKYSVKDDIEHIRELFRFFTDERYIKIDGKPMFLVYRTENMPDPGKTAAIWREEARKEGIEELYLVRVESIGKCDPNEINFDAALEFAPDWWNKGERIGTHQRNGEETQEELEAFNTLYAKNYIHTYDDLVKTMLAKPTPDYTWIRCVTPSWDNTARRKEGAHVFLNSNPEKYRHWLESIIDSSKKRLIGEEKMIFINAWNEWAEGNHLEPDQKYGREYLEQTFSALKSACTYLDQENESISPIAVESKAQQEIYQPKQRLAEKKVDEKELLASGQGKPLEGIRKSRSLRISESLRWFYLKLGSLKRLIDFQ